MRNIRNLLLGLAFTALTIAPGAASSGEQAAEALAIHRNIVRALSSDEVTLRVYSWEEYILPDMSAAEAESEGYEREAIDGINTRFENYMLSLGYNVNVVYDTFDTNETMLSQLKTGKIDYDLICPSDYTIQKMMNEDLIIPFDNEDEYPGSTPIYDEYVSPFLEEKLESIKAYDRYDYGDDATYEEGHVQDFMRGYMWGTLGFIYNPEFTKFQNRGISADKVREDITSVDILWDEDYRSTAFVKDAVRDTYAVLIIKAYKDEVDQLKEEYEAGTIDAETYNDELTEIFNRCDDDTLDLVGDTLRELSENIYGYEVDSGKDDIQKNTTVGIDLAWSGDAVYAMNESDSSGTGVRLEYALPEEGANIWFDGWVMTRNALSHGVTEIAQYYVDFLSMPFPESDDYDMGPAVANMDYIGYTSFIGGEDVFDYVSGSYDVRADEDGVIEDPDSLPEGEEGVDYVAKDVTYFFATEDDDPDVSYIIYQDSEEVNRQLDTMYPDYDQLDYLVVMADFGDQTDAVTRMWEANKAIQLPTWAYILVAVIVVLLLGYWIYTAVKHRNVRKRRKERREANRAKLAEAQAASSSSSSTAAAASVEPSAEIPTPDTPDTDSDQSTADTQ